MIESRFGFSAVCCAGVLLASIAFAIQTTTPETAKGAQKPEISGELKVWHRITLTFDGPHTGETEIPNPFTDYRLNVTFSKGSKRCSVPGYYAADGDAAHTSATHGNKWRVHFVADEPGEWEYSASFRTGTNIAVHPDRDSGKAVAFDGVKGAFTVAPSDKTGRDHRARGFLQYTGERYLRFSGTGEYFLKGGADSPENFLAYVDFDETFDSEGLQREGEAAGPEFIHTYGPHEEDWRDGDPTWKNGKGKNIIGALNYLSSKGMNSVYLITYNIDGGGWQRRLALDESRRAIAIRLQQAGSVGDCLFAHAETGLDAARHRPGTGE